MKQIEWEWVFAIVCVLAFFATLSYSNMITADRFASCEVRGGEMVKTDGEWQCKGGAK